MAALQDIESPLLPTSSGIWGISRWGLFNWSDGKDGIFDQIQAGNPSNIKDALIGETTIRNTLVLVTEDKKLRRIISRLGGQAITYDEFIKVIE